jgi:hypothetical protein
MSDVAATTPTVSESGATGTAAIAESVLQTLESPGESTQEASPAPSEPAQTTTETTPEPTPAVVQPPPSEAAQLLDEHGFKPKRSDGRENWIPYSKVEKIIENGINQGKGKFGEEHRRVLAERDTYSGQVQSLTPVLKKLDEGPEAFIAFAAEHDPRYRAFLQARQAPAPEPLADMPAPDVPLPNGGSTYSVEGLRKLLQWNTEQTEKRVEARLKPFQDAEQRRQQESARGQAYAQAKARTTQQIERAKSWPGFTEHEQAITEVLAADTERALSLHDAYMQVVGPTLQANEAKIREKVIKELQAQPTSTSVSRSGAESLSATAGQRTTADVARRVHDRLSRS